MRDDLHSPVRTRTLSAAPACLWARRLRCRSAASFTKRISRRSFPTKFLRQTSSWNLNLDQVVAAITARRDEYNLKPFFHAPPPDLETVHYRHEVMQDLEQETVIDFVKAFSAKMRSMREQIARLNKLHYRFQKEAVFLDAIAFYCDAVAQLAKDLEAANLKSRGLDGFRRHVEDYVQSRSFFVAGKRDEGNQARLGRD